MSNDSVFSISGSFVRRRTIAMSRATTATTTAVKTTNPTESSTIGMALARTALSEDPMAAE